MPLAFIACYAALQAYRQVRKALKVARKEANNRQVRKALKVAREEANDMMGEQSKPAPPPWPTLTPLRCEVDGGEAALVDKNEAGQPEGSAVAIEDIVTQRAAARARLDEEWSLEISRPLDENRHDPWLMQIGGTVRRACFRALRDREASLTPIFAECTPHCSPYVTLPFFLKIILLLICTTRLAPSF